MLQMAVRTWSSLCLGVTRTGAMSLLGTYFIVKLNVIRMTLREFFFTSVKFLCSHIHQFVQIFEDTPSWARMLRTETIPTVVVPYNRV